MFQEKLSDKFLKEKVVPSEMTQPTKEKNEYPVWYEYFDAGSHWCKVCNVMLASLFDMLTHLHTVSHKAVSHSFKIYIYI